MKRPVSSALLVAALCLGLSVLAGCEGNELAVGAGDSDAVGSGGNCTMCHGNPPTENHPDSENCRQCHPGTVSDDGTINAQGGLHKNNAVDYDAAATCSACHDNPPTEKHPDDSECKKCHSGSVQDDGTVDWASEVHANGIVDYDSATACAACHGNPPAAPHPDDANCRICHPSTVKDDGTIDHDSDLHNNGTVDYDNATACSFCHGNPPAAPHPQDDACHSCHGGTVMDDGTIDEEGGLHKNGTVEFGGEKACAVCHGYPPAAPHPADTTCNTCHPGSVKADGSLNAEEALHKNGTTEIEWKTATCGACHGLPPAAEDGHPPGNDCSVCHGCVVEDGQTISEAGEEFHANGSVEMKKCPGE